MDCARFGLFDSLVSDLLKFLLVDAKTWRWRRQKRRWVWVYKQSQRASAGGNTLRLAQSPRVRLWGRRRVCCIRRRQGTAECANTASVSVADARLVGSAPVTFGDPSFFRRDQRRPRHALKLAIINGSELSVE